MNARPILEVILKIMENVSPLPKWLRWCFVAFGVFLWIWPYVGLMKMLDISNMVLVECIIGLLIGACLGPYMIGLKARSIGNDIDKMSFECMLGGILLGILTGYIAISMSGDVFSDAFGDLSYMFMAIVCSFVGSLIFTAILLKYAGKTFIIDILDVDGDGDFDMDDIKAFVSKAKAKTEEVVEEVKEIKQ